MAYSPSNPPKLQCPAMGTDQPQQFVYRSADNAATVAGAGYFSDGKERGLRVGDVVVAIATGNGATTMHSVTAITAAGAATVSAAV